MKIQKHSGNDNCGDSDEIDGLEDELDVKKNAKYESESAENVNNTLVIPSYSLLLNSELNKSMCASFGKITKVILC